MTSFENEYLKHAVDIELYGNGFVQDELSSLGELYDKIVELLKKTASIATKKLYQAILDDIEDLIAQYESQMMSSIESRAEDITEEESSWLKDALFAVGISTLISKKLLNKVLFMPIASYTDYKDLAEYVPDRIRKDVDTVLKNSFLFKEPSEKMIERLEQRREKTQQLLENDIKTLNTGLFRNTDNVFFATNDIQVRYSAILDSHTCLVCGSYHGQIFPMSQAPLLPIHERCRCVLLPVIKGQTDDTEQESFSDWIDGLDEDGQKEVLGKSRYNLYKAGAKISSFVDSGKVLTLDELKERNTKKD